jgi:hypothetical protein
MRRALLEYLEGRTDQAIAALHVASGVDPQNDATLPPFPDGEDVYWTSRFYTRLGRTDLGVSGFRAAIDQGYFPIPLFEREPWLDPIRSEPAFVEAMEVARRRRQQSVHVFNEQRGPGLLGVDAPSV